MKDLFLLIAVIVGGVIAIRLYTRTMHPNTVSSARGSGAYQKLSHQEAKAKLDADETVILLDVRTEAEFNQGHIHGAVCLPVDRIFPDTRIVDEKDAEIIVYCQSGSRSTSAAKKLAHMGYTNVYDMGGIVAWPYGTTTE